MNFSVRLTNLSGTTLSAENSATIHAIVYEEAHVALTDRIVRAATYQPIIEPLDQGATASYSLETQDLLGVDWHNLYSIVPVDYRPDTSPEKYDMLQAAYAAHPDFRVSPNRLTFMIDPSDTGAPTVRMDFAGPPSLEWTLNENIPWLTASPTSGSLASQSSTLISVDPGNFSPGWQPEEEIIIMAESSEGSGFSVTVLVQAYYGELERLYLAALWR